MHHLETVHTDGAPAAIGPYSQAVRVRPSEMLFVSGQIPLVPGTMELVGGSAADQARQSLANLDAILVEAGYARTDVAKVTVFLSDMGYFGEVNEVYAEFFGDHKPARAAVAVKTLPKEVDVEIEAIAVKA